MLKIAGLILTFATSSLIGLLKAAELRKRRNLLIDFRELLLKISTEISYFKEPLPLIFNKLINDTDRESTYLLKSCVLMYSENNADMENIWKKSVEDVYMQTALTSDDIKLLKKAGEFIGQSDFKHQCEHFELLNIQLDRHISDSEKEIATKGRMYSRLGISIGAVLAIVFI